MDQRAIDLYAEYLKAPLKRRVFLARLAKLTGSESEALVLARELDALHAGTPSDTQSVRAMSSSGDKS